MPPRRALLIVSALALAAGLGGCRKPPPPPAPGHDQPTPFARTMVLAADILVIDGRHYRLADAAAPQGTPDGHCYGELMAAKYAVQQVKYMLMEAKSLDIRPTGATDSYNRAIAYVDLDGHDLGDLLYAYGIVAQPQSGRFNWCDPLSEATDHPPSLGSLFEPGR